MYWLKKNLVAIDLSLVWLNSDKLEFGNWDWSSFHWSVETLVKDKEPKALERMAGSAKSPKVLHLVLWQWETLLNTSVFNVSEGRLWFKKFRINRMLRTSTWSKNLSIPRLAKIGDEGDCGGLKVISLKADFCKVRMRWVVVLSERPQIWQAYRIWELKIAW